MQPIEVIKSKTDGCCGSLRCEPYETEYLCPACRTSGGRISHAAEMIGYFPDQWLAIHSQRGSAPFFTCEWCGQLFRLLMTRESARSPHCQLLTVEPMETDEDWFAIGHDPGQRPFWWMAGTTDLTGAYLIQRWYKERSADGEKLFQYRKESLTNFYDGMRRGLMEDAVWAARNKPDWKGIREPDKAYAEALESIRRYGIQMIRLSPAWSALVLWRIPYPGSLEVDCSVRPGELGLPATIVSRLEAWQASLPTSVLENRMTLRSAPVEGPRRDAIDVEGLAIAQEIKAFLGADWWVEYGDQPIGN